MTHRITESNKGVTQPCPAPARKTPSNCASAASPRPRTMRLRGVRANLIAKILSDLVGPQQPIDVRAFVEALVGDELELRGIFHAHSVSDFALEVSGVL